MKLRRIFFIMYVLPVMVLALNLFGILKVSWLLIASPYLLSFFLFSLYLTILFVWAKLEYNKQQRFLSKQEETTETSSFCYGCALPFDVPVRHLKGEKIFHKNCTPKIK